MVFVRDCECALTVLLVRTILYVLYDLHIVHNLQIISIEPLAAYVTDAHEYVLSLLGVSYAADQLRLAI